MRGGCEKDSTSLQVFIEALTNLVVVILDAYVSTSDCTCCLSNKTILEQVDLCLNANGWCSLWFTGASLHACNHSSHHLVTLEGDIAIFDAILAPMCSGNFLVTC